MPYSRILIGREQLEKIVSSLARTIRSAYQGAGHCLVPRWRQCGIGQASGRAGRQGRVDGRGGRGSGGSAATTHGFPHPRGEGLAKGY